MDPLLLGAIVAVATILVLFSGVSVAIGLLIVSAGFLIIFDGMRSLELMPEILFGKLDNFALLSIPMSSSWVLRSHRPARARIFTRRSNAG
jgi:TRAP-type mannitol/chloroaromatic compound transport system permease large subunit